MLLKLQDILLKKDRESLQALRHTLNNKELLSEKVNPIIEEHLTFMKEHFPIEFEKSVEKIIDDKLQASQEEILSLIYPKLGKMIQRYIQHQFQQLKESIDAQIEATINAGPLGWMRRKFFGIQVGEEILSNIDRPIIEQVFVIERGSGLLLGSAAVHEKIHQDVVAGMLTAIKSFSEDAFEKGNADLETIQYDTYQIFMQNFPRYYIALILGGSMSATEKKELSHNILTFAEHEMNIMIRKIDTDTNLRIKKKLEVYFFPSQNRNE